MNKKTHVLIIGAGQIGSRHLQGLASLQGPIMISVVDSNAQSLRLAKELYESTCNTCVDHHVNYFGTIAEIVGDVDLAIVATSAKNRRTVIEDMLRYCEPLYLIIEKLAFQYKEDFDAVIDLLSSRGIKTWVNCPRRMYDVYKSIKEQIESNERINIQACGGDWSLCSNAVHLIDLFQYLSSDPQDTKCVFYNFNEGLQSSKRPGYVELTGELLLTSANGGSLYLMSQQGSSRPMLIVIESESKRFLVDEFNHTMHCYLRFDGSSPETKKIDVPFQSTLTQLLVSDILMEGRCDIATLEQSYVSHVPLLTAVSQHFSQYEPQAEEILYIT